MTRHTILFLAANPSETGPLALDREAREIQVELERSRWRDRFELVTRWAAQPLDLLRELRRLAPTVVQFSAHGGGTADAGSRSNRDVVDDLVHPEAMPCRGLFFHGPDGRAHVVPAGAIGDVFSAAGHSVKLVIFNACYSEAAADAVLAHVDCVVGVSGSIGDHAARSFTVGFYGGLGERASIEAAYRGGCAAIGLEGHPDGSLPRLKVRPGTNAGQLILAALTPAEPRENTEAPPPPPAPGAVTSGDPGVAQTASPGVSLPARPAWPRAIAGGLVATATIVGGVIFATHREPPPVPAGMVRIEGAEIALGLDDAALARIVPDCPRSRTGCDHAAPLWRATNVPDVQISPFALDATEVTAADFAAWLTANRARLTIRDGAVFDASGPLAVIAVTDATPAQQRVLPLQWSPGGAITAAPARERAPMTMVTWLGAQEYCIAHGARLPTEAEWELAARGPHGAAEPWGDPAPTCAGVVFGRASDPVWRLPKGLCAAPGAPEAPEVVELGAATIDRSSAGVLGLAGNVREWVLDSFDASLPGYPACRAPCKDPWAELPGQPFVATGIGAWLSEPGFDHVIRGCSFLDPALRCHGAARGYNNGYASVASADPRVGFRCAKGLAR
jgi:formylglycine-generating enzyme required for sulfatase activity